MNLKLYFQRKKIERLWNAIWKAKTTIKLKLYEGVPCTNEELIDLSNSIDSNFEQIRALQKQL